MTSAPLVSACVITYNQEKFVRQTIEACCAQLVAGEYEIVIGDDASTDSTPAIIAEMALIDPRIRVLPTEKNLGMHGNWARTIAGCRGKYTAICEGDDVWTDPYKLQKQIALLEKEPELSGCFSNANVIDAEGNPDKWPYVDRNFDKLDGKRFFELNFNPIPTCTTVFRSALFTGFPAEYYTSPFADWILHSLLIQKGAYVFLNEVTSSYRKHEGGVWTGLKEEKQLLNKLKALNIIDKIVDRNHSSSVHIAKQKQHDKLLYFYRDEKEWMKYLTTWMKLKLM